MRPHEKQLLQKELQILDKAAAMLKHSFETCKSIENKSDYTLAELDLFEALTSRFARLNDIIIRKMFRLIDRLDIEPEGTVRDSINRAEKKNLIDNTDQFGSAREVHNIIAHEYLLENMSLLYRKVMVGTPILIEVVERIKNYCKRY